MRKKSFIKFISLLFFLFILSACATTSHKPYKVEFKVDDNAIQNNKNRVFRLGIVKVKGAIPNLIFISGDKLDKKIMALEKIPISDICNTLSSNYGLKIDTEINNEIKIVKEEIAGQITGASGTPPPKPGLSMTVTVPSMSQNP